MTLTITYERPPRVRNNAPFSDDENATLRAMCAEGVAYEAIATALGRSRFAVKQQADVLRLEKAPARPGGRPPAMAHAGHCRRCGLLLARAPAGHDGLCGHCVKETTP